MADSIVVINLGVGTSLLTQAAIQGNQMAFVGGAFLLLVAGMVAEVEG